MAIPFELNYQAGRAYWQADILWVVLVESRDTDGRYSLLWELCPKYAGPPPHSHDQDEGFFIIDGDVTFRVDDQELVARQGSFVSIPRGAVHSFRVDSTTATLLNFYTPAGFERTITEAGHPATTFSLPLKGLPMALPQPDLLKLFAQVGMHPLDHPDVLRPAS